MKGSLRIEGDFEPGVCGKKISPLPNSHGMVGCRVATRKPGACMNVRSGPPPAGQLCTSMGWFGLRRLLVNQ